MVDGAVIRLTSVPMKVKGAQHASAQGIPQTDTSMVAMCNERTKGARNMAPAKMMWLSIHAVSRSGLEVLTSFARGARGARTAGGRGVKLRWPGLDSSSGDLTTKGRKIEPMNVTSEKMSRDKDPMRPMSPRGSDESAIEAVGV